MKESDYQPHLEAAVNQPGSPARLWRQNAGAAPKRDHDGEVVGVFHGAPTGAADASGSTRPDGIRLEVEVKSPRRKVTDDQKLWAHRMKAAGCIYVVCRYDAKLSLEENLDVHVALIESCIEERRSTGKGVARPEHEVMLKGRAL